MRYILVLICLCMNAGLAAQNWEDQQVFGSDAARTSLRVLSSTDTSFFAPIIKDYLDLNQDVNVQYSVTSTAELDGIFRSEPSAFDVVVSSAMDLQLKLANDGYSLRLDRVTHPDWAQWRQSLFGFTSESAAIVVKNAAFANGDVPTTRQGLIAALRTSPDQFRNKLGTYDVRISGLGYLFATQDARASETYWRLTEVMGGLSAKLYCCSGSMIDDLLSGDIVVAYNVLSSYAAARLENDPRFSIILPSDFPTTMMRTALVSKKTRVPELAEDFVSHLIKTQSESADKKLTLPPLNTDQARTEFAAIALEPALLTYLDRLKRRTFLSEWQDAILQDQ